MKTKKTLTKQVKHLERDLGGADETYRKVIDVAGPRLESTPEGQEVLEYAEDQRITVYR